jgi:hypothetical protein
MITNEGKYYLYRHIRLDKEEPFYIGIGKKYSSCINSEYFKRVYKRAFDTHQRRNSIWSRITSKTSYEVEILLESNDLQFIKNKEREFVHFYGRKDLGTGILANLTDGGEGSLNKKCKPESILKTMEAHYISVTHISTGEVFTSIKEAAQAYGLKYRKLSAQLKNKVFGCPFIYTGHPVVIENNKTCIRIQKISTGQVFSSIRKAALDLGTDHKTLKKWIEENKSIDYRYLNKKEAA